MLKGKNSLITGARRGIGRATVEVFAKNGANVWACARQYDESFEQDMNRIADEYKVQITPLYFDVTDETQVKQAIQTIRKQKVNVDSLINVAGISIDGTSFQMTQIERMKQIFEVNFFSMTLLTQYVSRLMIRQNSGSIVNFVSISGIDATPAQYEYAASKAAIIGGTKNLAREFSKYNIRVNAIAPGLIETDMVAQVNDEIMNGILYNVMMKRMGRPEEVANAAAFLASDLSSYMTGQVIRVDGGI